MVDGNPGDKLWNRHFLLACLANLTMFAGFHMLTTTFPFYVIRLGGDQALAGLAAGLFSISAVLLRPFIGWILDHRGRRPALLLGLSAMVVFPLLYRAFPWLLLVISLRVVHGLGWSSATTALNTSASDSIPRRRFAEGMGYFGLTSALATAIAPGLGLAIMNGQGFQRLFDWAALAALLSLLLSLWMGRPALPRPASRPGWRFSLKTLVDKDAAPAALIILLFLIPYGGITTFVAMYAADLGLGSGGLYFTCLAAATALMRLLTGRTADRYGEGPLVWAGIGCELGSLLLLASRPAFPGFILSALLFGAAFGMLSPALQAMALRIVPLERRGGASSTFLCGYDIGIGLGGMIAGQLVKTFDYALAYGLLTAFALLALAAYWFWGRKSPSAFRKGRAKGG